MPHPNTTQSQFLNLCSASNATVIRNVLNALRLIDPSLTVSISAGVGESNADRLRIKWVSAGIGSMLALEVLDT